MTCFHGEREGLKEDFTVGRASEAAERVSEAAGKASKVENFRGKRKRRKGRKNPHCDGAICHRPLRDGSEYPISKEKKEFRSIHMVYKRLYMSIYGLPGQ